MDKIYNRSEIFPIIAWIICLSLICCSVAFAEKPIHKGYPMVFNETGTISRLGSDKIVIGDTLLLLTKTTTYHAPGTTFGSRSLFQTGNFVGILTNPENTREVLSLWLIKKGKNKL